MAIEYSRYSKGFIENLLEEISVTRTQYEMAERAFRSLSEWIRRPHSTLVSKLPETYLQGSFRLGTAVKPATQDGELDIDLVCQVQGSKGSDTQQDIKDAVGKEVTSYAASQGVQVDEPGNRCWTLLYAEDTKFHMDVLPAIPDGDTRKLLLEQRGLQSEFADQSIAITDVRRPEFRLISDDWPHSNPKGYARWFRLRGGAEFERRRQILFEAELFADYETADEIPQNRLRTPLQGVVQLLKRHRDMMFEGRSEKKPISIIIATLSAITYNQESDVPSALYSILYSMDRHIEDRDGVAWIESPADPLENFADKWEQNKELEECFYEWLETARDDFESIAAASSGAMIAEEMRNKFGEREVSTAVARSLQESYLTERSNVPVVVRPIPAAIKVAGHKQQPQWASHPRIIGSVNIVEARVGKSRWRAVRIRSGDNALPKGCDLRFRAKTNVSKPYQVFWRTLNTGADAAADGQLRGDINDQQTQEGGLVRKESTRYSGSHSVECFIVKDGYLAARSGEFVVNIE